MVPTGVVILSQEGITGRRDIAANGGGRFGEINRDVSADLKNSVV